MLGDDLMCRDWCDQCVVALKPLSWKSSRIYTSRVMPSQDGAATMIADGIQFVAIVGAVVGDTVFGKIEIGCHRTFDQSLIFVDDVFISF